MTVELMFDGFSVGNEETPRAQPIPSVTVGYGGDWMSLSPIALQFWVSFKQ